MIRAFLAIELPETVRTALSRLQFDLKQYVEKESPRNARIAWVRPEAIHLTVKFLGDIDEGMVHTMREAIGLTVRDRQAIHISLERLGVFPRLQQPRILWIGPSDRWEQGDEAKRLAALHDSVEACCVTLDLAPDSRPLSPHVTLARIKAGERSIGQMLAQSGVMDRSVECGVLPVGSIVLMQSKLTPSGSVYTTLWDVKLEG